MEKKKSSASKAKAGDAESTSKKIKLPKSYILRPNYAENHLNKSISKVWVNNDILIGTDITSGSVVLVRNAESSSPGVVARVFESKECDKTELLMSPNLRKLGAFLLGDRVVFSTFGKQPSYAQDVHIAAIEQNTPSGAQSTKIDFELWRKPIQKTLDDIGLVCPGMAFLATLDGVTTQLSLIDISTDVQERLEGLSLDSKSSDSATVSPPFIYAKGKTDIIQAATATFSKTKYPYLPLPTGFLSIGGLDKEISLLRSIIEVPLNNPGLFAEFGIAPPRGVLLHGPPGTGKTMLLRSVANEVDAHVLTVNGPSIVSKYLGETENALREIFLEARQYQPSIIFMDEIDSLAPNRNSDDSGETESRVVATLLTMMDGMGESGRVVVIGATNRPNSLDPALRRPGRFDQEVEIGIPDVNARLDILSKQFGKMSKEKCCLDEKDISAVALKTHGYVGADLTALCRESVMKAINRGKRAGTPQGDIKLYIEDVEEALLEIRPSAMREIFLEMPKVYWTDIGGQEELKRKLVEVVQLPLEAAPTFANLGVLAPRGVLLYGPPGCSKTLTAKALATELGLNFLAVKGPEIFNKYVGESERTIREIFRKARAASPSIIFFDEIDAISGDRDSASTSAALQVLTTLLNEIDGVEELNGVVIVAATNRPTEIDPALLRPGRLDRHIYVGPPDLEARLQILQTRTAKFNLPESVSLAEIAELTEGCSGAEVALVSQEAGLAAVMENKSATRVEKRHFDHALKGVSRGITEDMLEYYREFAARGGLNV